MSVREDLIAARALIDTPNKWRKNGRLDGGRCCAWNAMFNICGEQRFLDAERALSEALPAGVPRDNMWRGVTTFNDDPRTTHADIMALFDRAIKAAE